MTAILDQIVSAKKLIMMKRKLSTINLKLSLLFPFIIATIFAFVPPKYSLIGQWSLLQPDGTPTGEYVFFKKDSTYFISLANGQIGERGMYF